MIIKTDKIFQMMFSQLIFSSINLSLLNRLYTPILKKIKMKMEATLLLMLINKEQANQGRATEQHWARQLYHSTTSSKKTNYLIENSKKDQHLLSQTLKWPTSISKFHQTTNHPKTEWMKLYLLYLKQIKVNSK